MRHKPVKDLKVYMIDLLPWEIWSRSLPPTLISQR